MKSMQKRYQTEVRGVKGDITVTYIHDPVAAKDARQMLVGMIVQQLMDDMMKQVGEG